MITIGERPAGDAELVLLLEAAFAELVSRYGPEGRSRVHDQARYLLAGLTGKPAGCGALQPSGHDNIGELKRMYVVPELRGRGIASALLASLETLAAETGYTALRLATGLRQPEAIALYEKHGYQPTEPYGKYLNDSWSRCYHKVL